MKLSQKEIATAVIELQEESKTLTNFSHPYWGLKDKKGWLSRYPLTTEAYKPAVLSEEEKRTLTTREILDRRIVFQQGLISQEWMQSFIHQGGTLDAQGTYGISPYETELEDYSPSQVVGWLKDAHCERWDNVPQLCWITKHVDISDTATLADLYRMNRGAMFINECIKWGWNPMTDGGWSIFKCAKAFKKYNEYQESPRFHAGPIFIRFISKYYTTISSEYMKRGRNKHNESWCDLGKDYIPTNLEQKIINDTEKYSRRMSFKQKTGNRIGYNGQPPYWSRTSNHSTCSSRLAAEYAAKNTAEYYGTTVVTTVGRVHIRTHKTGEAIAIQGKLLKPRNVAGLQVVKVADICFAWDKTFKDHNEGLTIKDAIDAFLGRTGIDSTSVSFQMVRKAKGYCLNGTRNWLRSNMPFLAYLLSPYSGWSDVPSELMNTVWEFSSREVFRNKL